MWHTVRRENGGLKVEWKGTLADKVVEGAATHQGVDWRIILRRIFRKWDVGVWTTLSWLRIETGGGHL
jgi:hypothetical protein